MPKGELKKLSAFTLQEIIVVMLLSSVLVSLFYYMLMFIQKDITRITSVRNFENEKIILEEQLMNDLDGFKKITVVQNDLTIFKIDSKILYHPGDSLLERNQTVIPIENNVIHKTEFLCKAYFILKKTEIELCIYAVLDHGEQDVDTLYICTPTSTETDLHSQILKQL